ncbi:hypothetical protein QYE76_062831 [Lolium multiflorum]|uniref:Uncharacterized protein n=1 Tax=Lolium multiflorum TaxID=4521 RepID=A0AAD8S4Z9_LOLMU|nr:hypothetical protein QYE76_062831 [Lolium multiflorum]
MVEFKIMGLHHINLTPTPPLRSRCLTGFVAFVEMQLFYNGFLVHPHAIYETMEEINDQTENMKQIQDALSAPIGASADFDEDELEELEGAELENQLLEPVPYHQVQLVDNM